ncbi:hypothetical protein QM797_08940 [Rhodococcus sp. IEGM 1381]|uniref:hypothetical protein n=1 Tax=Rhodococcus sp. IEGM 1381 TaxID=3047085 RepID=UPI0024B8220C|nr:hypothetical protein [Rhodococcus sp. IEGM 1381]MDI9894849.1 hypothetical protein [Rhodococcus sp. IEGM 1381]
MSETTYGSSFVTTSVTTHDTGGWQWSKIRGPASSDPWHPGRVPNHAAGAARFIGPNSATSDAATWVSSGYDSVAAVVLDDAGMIAEYVPAIVSAVRSVRLVAQLHGAGAENSPAPIAATVNWLASAGHGSADLQSRLSDLQWSTARGAVNAITRCAGPVACHGLFGLGNMVAVGTGIEVLSGPWRSSASAEYDVGCLLGELRELHARSIVLGENGQAIREAHNEIRAAATEIGYDAEAIDSAEIFRLISHYREFASSMGDPTAMESMADVIASTV